jgi:hypothetical protein
MDKVKVVVTEGVAGHFHYHLSDSKDVGKGFCGAYTMGSHLP